MTECEHMIKCGELEVVEQAKPFSPFGEDLFGHSIEQAKQGLVSKRFLVAPFTVLNSRDGDWQERKRAWRAIGIEGEVGRDAKWAETAEVEYFDFYRKKEARKVSGSNSTTGKNSCMKKTSQGLSVNEDGSASVTSLFDPVLCEIVYRWFSREGSQIVDPFCGGSVRGVVASLLGRNYWGSELRIEQVESNRKQATTICKTNVPEFILGDSLVTIPSAPECDLVFSCPPYGDLEVYSDDPQDLSAMSHEAFTEAYREIVRLSCERLKDNRFACFVVGDFRGKNGLYRNFVSETIRAFLDVGLGLYNEAVLVTSVGSASMRVSKQFDSGRKFAKTHQNVLVFCKGDWKEAANYVNSK